MAQVNPPQTEPSATPVAGESWRPTPAEAKTPPASRDATQDLAHLFHMSPTAGVGTTDYAAINSLSIVALLLGLGSVAALTSNVMLLVPLAGVICSLVAFRQILHSNGTQDGKSFAAIGLICSLAMGVGTVGARLVDYRHTVDDQRQIAQQLANVGDDIIQDHLSELYDRVSDRFKERISKDLFISRMSALQSGALIGKLTAVRWNEEPMYFQGGDGGSDRVATAMAVMTFSKVQDVNRELFSFVRRGNQWVLDNIPGLFPADRGKKPSQRGAPPGASVGP